MAGTLEKTVVALFLTKLLFLRAQKVSLAYLLADHAASLILSFYALLKDSQILEKERLAHFDAVKLNQALFAQEQLVRSLRTTNSSQNEHIRLLEKELFSSKTLEEILMVLSRPGTTDLEDPERLKRKNMRCKMKLIERGKQIELHKSRIKELVYEKKHVKDQLQRARDQHAQQIQSMNTLYSKLNALKCQMEMDNDKLELNKYLETKEAQILAKDREIEGLKDAKMKVELELENRMTDYFSLFNSLSELQSKNDSFKEEVSKLEFKLSRLEKDNKRLRIERAKLEKEKEAIQKVSEKHLTDRENQIIRHYSLKLSEVQLLERVKTSKIQKLNRQLMDLQEFSGQLVPFLDKFSERFRRAMSVMAELLPKYAEQKMFLDKLAQTIVIEEKNFLLLSELREKNHRFKHILKKIIEENGSLKGEISLLNEEVSILKNQASLKDEYIKVLGGQVDSFPEKLNEIPNYKSIIIDGFQVGPDSLLIPCPTSATSSSFGYSDSPDLEKSLKSVISNATSVTTANSINIVLDDLLFFDRDEKFGHQLNAFLKSGVFESGGEFSDSEFGSQCSPKLDYQDDAMFEDEILENPNEFELVAREFDLELAHLQRLISKAEPLKKLDMSRKLELSPLSGGPEPCLSGSKFSVFRDPAESSDVIDNASPKPQFSRPRGLFHENVFFKTSKKTLPSSSQLHRQPQQLSVNTNINPI